MPLYFHQNAKKWALQILSSKDKKSVIEQIEKTNKDINITITQQAKDKLKNTQNLAKKLGIRGTPTLFVIDLKDKKVVDIIKGANIPKIQTWIAKDKNEK
jgi:thiol:disulfide interchange protein DsbC